MNLYKVEWGSGGATLLSRRPTKKEIGPNDRAYRFDGFFVPDGGTVKLDSTGVITVAFMKESGEEEIQNYQGIEERYIHGPSAN